MSHAADAAAIDAILEPRGQTFASVTDHVIGVTRRPVGWKWLAMVGIALSGMMMMLTAISWLLYYGVGVWGINIPVGWGFAIINFVWWIGIGHAGTFISAILLLCKQRWRNSINRFAEAMTLFAVANAGLFPLLHLGRIQRFYYLFPYPNTENVWPQWRSPLVWDVFAVSTYGTVSLLFWYVGLIPDLAAQRDAAKTKLAALISGFFALGWRGEVRQWQRHQTLYLIFAGLSTPLVLSVHSIVSFDFSAGIVPGWHSTIFPPYFVAGAVFAGFAMVATLVIPIRRIYQLEDLITTQHLNNMGKIILVTGLFVSYGYLMETFAGYFSGDVYEIGMTNQRMFGHYAFAFWGAIVCNVLAPQLLWMKGFRTNPVLLFFVCQFVNVGMWFERYMIVVGSLSRDFLPSSWRIYEATRWDWMLYIGTMFFFFFLVLMFIRLLPMISVFEIRELLHHAHPAQAEAHGSPAAEVAQAQVPAVLRIRPEDLYGLVAEFQTAEQLEAAAKQVTMAGYRSVNAYSPLPMEDLPDTMELRRSSIPSLMLLGGIGGGLTGFAFQTWTSVYDYPWNIGGRPYFSWPAFIPITFELTILGAATVGLVALLMQCKFPQLYHPISNTPNFKRASTDRFFLAIETADPQFERSKTQQLLESLSPVMVSEVPR